MITLTTSKKSLLTHKTTCFAIMLEQGFSYSDELHDLTKAVFPECKDLLKQREFTGALSSSIVIPFTHFNKVAYFILVGVGKANEKGIISLENYRRALGKIVRIVEDLKATSVTIQLPSPKGFNCSAHELAHQTASTVAIAEYHFDTFITDKTRKVPNDIAVTIAYGSLSDQAIEEGVNQGTIIADAVNQARHWIDMPPVHLTPVELASKATAIAKKNKLKITIFDEKEATQMGMGGIAAVSRGSDHDAQFVIMEYKSSVKNAPLLALVGKGITFDSGGLSIKPAVHMETMKEDMSGAAAVIAAMDAIGQLKPPVHIVAITPLCENLPSGKATKPGDIATFYNGKTAEIKNTDAEGRLVLADALSYAVKHYKPDAIIDLATLTGACAHALGPFFAGLMSNHDDVIEQVTKAAQRSGDFVWRLPLTDDYKPAIRSEVADLSNIGSQKYMAGAITAALFLQNFVDDVPWLHLDIAGVAFDVPDLPYYRPHSATGFGVRLLVDLVQNWPKNS